MAYGASIPGLMRRSATYVDKIMKGAKPGELPIQQPTKFDLVINTRTAKALVLTLRPLFSPAPTRLSSEPQVIHPDRSRPHCNH
jgi:ABC-type uncharacterized transport system substrate-binding protein